MELSADDVAGIIRHFLDGTGGRWDWDDFTSISIADPALNSIRERALSVPLPCGDAELATLRSLLAEAEALCE